MFFLVQFMEDWYLYHPNSCPQILPTPHPSPVSVSVDFLAVVSLGISEKCPKNFSQRWQTRVCADLRRIFLDQKPNPPDHTLFWVTISLLIQEMRRLSLRSKEEILCFSVLYYVCVQLFIIFSYLSISFLLICYVSYLALKLYSWKSLYDSLF